MKSALTARKSTSLEGAAEVTSAAWGLGRLGSTCRFRPMSGPIFSLKSFAISGERSHAEASRATPARVAATASRLEEETDFRSISVHSSCREVGLKCQPREAPAHRRAGEEVAG